MKIPKFYSKEMVDLADMQAVPELVKQGMQELIATILYPSFAKFSGLGITQQATADGTVLLGAGTGLDAGKLVKLTESQTIRILSGASGWGTPQAADATNPRYSSVFIKYTTIDTDSVAKTFIDDADPGNPVTYQQTVASRVSDYYDITVAHGVAAASPAVPATPDGYTRVCDIYVATNVTTVTTANITNVLPAASETLDALSSASITDFAEAAQDAIGSIISNPTANAVIITYDDAGNTLSADVKVDDVTITKNASGALIIKTNGVTDTQIGNRTVDQATATAYASTGALTQILSWFAKRFNGIIGATNWYDAIPATLTTIWGKFHADTGHKHTGVAGDAPQITSGSVSDFTEAAQDAVGGAISNPATSGATLTYNDTTGALSADVKVDATTIEKGASGNLQLKDSGTTDTKIGNRTADQAIATAYASTGTLTQLLSWFAKMIKTITGGTNWYSDPEITLAAAKLHTTDYTLQIPYAGDTSGTAPAYTISTPAITGAYAAGMAVTVKFHASYNGAATLNWCGLGAKAIVKAGGGTPNIKAGVYTLRYDGTSFQLQGEGGGEYGTAGAPQTLTGYTIGTDSGIVSGSMPENGSVGTVTLATNNQTYTIPAGHHSGAGIVKAVITNLTAANVKYNAVVGGTTGSYDYEGTNPITAADVLLNHIGFVNGSKITGSMANNASPTATITTHNGTVTIPAGYNPGGTITAALTNFAANVIKYNTTVGGTAGTYDYEATAPAAAANILSGKIAFVNGVKLTGTMASNAAPTYTITTNGGTKVVPAGYNPGGTITASLTNFAANVIKYNVVVGGTTGNYDYEATAPAAAANILTGKIAFVNGTKLTGTMANNAAPTYTITTQGGTKVVPVGYNPGGTITASLTNFAANVIKYGTTVGGTAGTFSYTASNPITAAAVQSGKIGFVNGSQITGAALIAPSALSGEFVRYNKKISTSYGYIQAWNNPSAVTFFYGGQDFGTGCRLHKFDATTMVMTTLVNVPCKDSSGVTGNEGGSPLWMYVSADGNVIYAMIRSTYSGEDQTIKWSSATGIVTVGYAGVAFKIHGAKSDGSQAILSQSNMLYLWTTSLTTISSNFYYGQNPNPVVCSNDFSVIAYVESTATSTIKKYGYGNLVTDYKDGLKCTPDGTIYYRDTSNNIAKIVGTTKTIICNSTAFAAANVFAVTANGKYIVQIDSSGATQQIYGVAEATTFAADGRPVECNHNYSNLCPVIPSVDDKTLWNVQATGTGYNNLREKVTKL